MTLSVCALPYTSAVPEFQRVEHYYLQSPKNRVSLGANVEKSMGRTRRLHRVIDTR